MFGFLNVLKPKGFTSHDVISRLRKVTGIKKIGHSGTLDPSAEGVLPVGIGNATRLLDYLPPEKEYSAEFILGYTSPSYDTDTASEKFSDKKVKESDIIKLLPLFTGKILQKPPLYSAVKINGRKLYDVARKGGCIEIPDKEIYVEKIILSHFDFELQTGKLYIACSKGTYIRSIINDLGVKLNTGGVMSYLLRTKSGSFDIGSSVNLNDITSVETVAENLVNPLDVLPFSKISLSDDLFVKVKNGNSFSYSGENGIVFLIYEGHPVALGDLCDNFIKIRKVFL